MSDAQPDSAGFAAVGEDAAEVREGHRRELQLGHFCIREGQLVGEGFGVVRENLSSAIFACGNASRWETAFKLLAKLQLDPQANEVSFNYAFFCMREGQPVGEGFGAVGDDAAEAREGQRIELHHFCMREGLPVGKGFAASREDSPDATEGSRCELHRYYKSLRECQPVGEGFAAYVEAAGARESQCAEARGGKLGEVSGLHRRPRARSRCREANEATREAIAPLSDGPSDVRRVSLRRSVQFVGGRCALRLRARCV